MSLSCVYCWSVPFSTHLTHLLPRHEPRGLTGGRHLTPAAIEEGRCCTLLDVPHDDRSLRRGSSREPETTPTHIYTTGSGGRDRLRLDYVYRVWGLGLSATPESGGPTGSRGPLVWDGSPSHKTPVSPLGGTSVPVSGLERPVPTRSDVSSS